MAPHVFLRKDAYGIQDLLVIMAILRGEDGCVWDREQNHHTIRNNFIEETYEAVEAIDQEDCALLQEELGDVLLQIVFHTQMEQELGNFSFGDVCDGICKKLIYRHPHVFGDVEVSGSAEVLQNWDRLKTAEKKQETVTDTLRGVSTALPGLMRSAKVQKRAAKAGFCPPSIGDAIADLKGGIARLEEALARGDRQSVGEEVGDILFSAVNVSRMAGEEAEEAVGRSTERFIRRVAAAETLAIKNDIDLSSCRIDELSDLWSKAKEKE